MIILAFFKLVLRSEYANKAYDAVSISIALFVVFQYIISFPINKIHSNERITTSSSNLKSAFETNASRYVIKQTYFEDISQYIRLVMNIMQYITEK